MRERQGDGQVPEEPLEPTRPSERSGLTTLFLHAAWTSQLSPHDRGQTLLSDGVVEAEAGQARLFCTFTPTFFIVSRRGVLCARCKNVLWSSPDGTAEENSPLQGTGLGHRLPSLHVMVSSHHSLIQKQFVGHLLGGKHVLGADFSIHENFIGAHIAWLALCLLRLKV